ncbi:MAG TPA: ribosome maturation factor RimM [Bacteroidales bacterium]|nr:ribosome maturation factor RimM [Bacteroidales bacterium]
MKKSDCRLLGTLSKPHGYKGQMVLMAEDTLPENFEDWESVFVEIDGLLVPFLFDDINHTHTDSAIVRFEDYESIDLIQELVHCKVYAPLKNFRKKRNRSFDPSELNTYTVIDSKYGEIGRVEEILDYNENVLLRILKDQKEILIPAQEPIIESIDSRKKIIYINAPAGLIEIYLE